MDGWMNNFKSIAHIALQSLYNHSEMNNSVSEAIV